MSNGNGVQAVGAVDEVFDADGVFVCVVEYLLGHGIKHGQFLIGKRGKPLGKEVQLVQAEGVQADVLQLRQDRYERAVAWLRQVQKSDIKPNLPIIDEDGDGKPDTAGEYIYGSNPKRNQHF